MAEERPATGAEALFATRVAFFLPGIATAAWAPLVPYAQARFALLGLGASNIVPVLYSALGRQSRVPLAVTVCGYLGILSGPALIGFAAQATSLSAALLAACAPLMPLR